ncbi:MAG: cupin domain-containing protein [Phycisphaerales bacterium]
MAPPLADASTHRFLSLLDACPVVAGANVSRALVNLPEGKVVLFAMDEGQEISEHRAPHVAVVQVLDGKLLFRVGGEEREMGPHAWLVMPADAPHSLRALAPTRFVLTVLKAGGR